MALSLQNQKKKYLCSRFLFCFSSRWTYSAAILEAPQTGSQCSPKLRKKKQTDLGLIVSTVMTLSALTSNAEFRRTWDTGPSVSLKRYKSSSAVVSLGSVTNRRRRAARTQSPGSPNIQGIKRHLARESLPLFPTLRAAFYSPFFLISSRPRCLSALQTFHLITLISPKVLSFILSPTCSPLGASH